MKVYPTYAAAVRRVQAVCSIGYDSRKTDHIVVRRSDGFHVYILYKDYVGWRIRQPHEQFDDDVPNVIVDDDLDEPLSCVYRGRPVVVYKDAIQ